jgi:hypothetical protein
MKSTLAASGPQTAPVHSPAETSNSALALLAAALAQLDSIDADTAIRARLQGIIEDLEAPAAE